MSDDESSSHKLLENDLDETDLDADDVFEDESTSKAKKRGKRGKGLIYEAILSFKSVEIAVEKLKKEKLFSFNYFFLI